MTNSSVANKRKLRVIDIAVKTSCESGYVVFIELLIVIQSATTGLVVSAQLRCYQTH